MMPPKRMGRSRVASHVPSDGNRMERTVGFLPRALDVAERIAQYQEVRLSPSGLNYAANGGAVQRGGAGPSASPHPGLVESAQHRRSFKDSGQCSNSSPLCAWLTGFIMAAMILSSDGNRADTWRNSN